MTTIFDRERDLKEIGVGPVMLDIDMARRLGWTDEEIHETWRALRFVVLGVGLDRDLRSGRMCEHCGACKPRVMPMTEPGALPQCGALDESHRVPERDL